ncbi:MAG: S1/P1 nuclease [Pyrinomonadaceae bacterium]|nr:S1/P1 nuclease [Pyrinomonadaceae bacterium]MBP9109266.1 S1/P1 nuclease [Pyrinomonadaceae bacterium]
MFKAAVRLMLIGSLLSILGTSVFAWDEVGHKITGYVAWQRMTPEVRERVHKILMAAPEDSQIASFYMLYGARTEELRKREYFMFMTTWADVVRDRNFEMRYKNYHKGNWHYDDKFWTVKNGKIEYLPAPEDGGQALERLKTYSEMIRGRANDSQKAVAIAWIEHIIGDLHQPLHTSARVTDVEPKGDQGGNLFLLTPQGTPRANQENLHWFWDSIVVRNMPNTKNECDTEFIEPIAQKFMKKYPFEKNQSRLALGRFEDWTEESLKLAQEGVFSADLVRFQMPSDKYKKKGLTIAEERLVMAGYRMGELFNSVFGTAAATTVSPN